MENKTLQARLHIGNHMEVIANDDEKTALIVLLSSRLEDERSGAIGEIYDLSCKEVVYRCRRSAY